MRRADIILAVSVLSVGAFLAQAVAGIHGHGRWVQRDVYDPWDANVLEANVWVYRSEILPGGDANYQYLTLPAWWADVAALGAGTNVAGLDGNRLRTAAEFWAECYSGELMPPAMVNSSLVDTPTRFVSVYAAPGHAQDGTSNPAQGARISYAATDINVANLQSRGLDYTRVRGIRFNADSNLTSLTSGVNFFTRYPSSATGPMLRGCVVRDCYFRWAKWQYHAMPIRFEVVAGTAAKTFTTMGTLYAINNVIEGNRCALASAQAGNYGIWISPSSNNLDGNIVVNAHLHHNTVANLTAGGSGGAGQSTMISTHVYYSPIDANWTVKAGTITVNIDATNIIACQASASDAEAFSQLVDAGANATITWTGSHNVSHDATASTLFGGDANAEPNRVSSTVLRGLLDMRIIVGGPAYHSGLTTLPSSDSIGRLFASPPSRGALEHYDATRRGRVLRLLSRVPDPMSRYGLARNPLARRDREGR